MGRVLGVVGRTLVGLGIVVLGFVAYQLWGTGLETARGQRELTEDLASNAGAADPDTGAGPVDLEQLEQQLSSIDPATAPATPPPPEGEAVGILTIDKIGLQDVLVEGASTADLKKGPGHYSGTALPGQPGNAGLAGHRTTYGAPFNRIDELSPGDEIRIATPQGQFVYDVIPAPGQSTQAWYTVEPSQLDVLSDTGDNRVTLTACHPKYSARLRIIVHAVLRADAAAVADAVDSAPPSAPVVEARAEDFDEGLNGDPEALAPALLLGVAAAALTILAAVLGHYYRRWLVYVLAAPGVLVLVWFGYVHMDRFLPAL